MNVAHGCRRKSRGASSRARRDCSNLLGSLMANWLLLARWAYEGVCCEALSQSSIEAPEMFENCAGTATGCVWALAVFEHERRAWMATFRERMGPLMRISRTARLTASSSKPTPFIVRAEERAISRGHRDQDRPTAGDHDGTRGYRNATRSAGE
jgi:hypothetical protein